MKTMNYLFTTVFVLLVSACSNEPQLIAEELEATKFRGAENQEETILLEIDFHQAFLVWEEREIRDEMIALQKGFENGDKGNQRFEVLQKNLKRNRLDYRANEEREIRNEMIALQKGFKNGDKWRQRFEVLQKNLERNRLDYRANEKWIDKFGRGPIGGIGPGRPCGDKPDPASICPIPIRFLEGLCIARSKCEDCKIEILTGDGEVCGTMIDMKPVSYRDEQFAQAIFDFDAEAAEQIRFTKLSETGELFSYTLPIE